MDLKLVGMIREKNGGIVQTGAGNRVGAIRRCSGLAANAVGNLEQCLEAGEIIMPGAVVLRMSAPICSASFDGLGTVSYALYGWLMDKFARRF